MQTTLHSSAVAESSPLGHPTLKSVLDSMTDGFAVIDRQWQLMILNAPGVRLLKPPASETPAPGQGLWDAFPHLAGTEMETELRKAMECPQPVQFDVYCEPVQRFLEVRASPSDAGLSVYFLDVTQRKQAEVQAASERKVLQAVHAGAPMPELLDLVCRETQAQSHNGMLCSILLLSESGDMLHPVAGPCLSDRYHQALAGVPVAAGEGSCGSAAFRRSRVCVVDIESDPRWDGYRQIARSEGLRACCSQPILSGDGDVLGTIAAYYRDAKAPTPHDDQLIALACQLAAIVIERSRAQAAVRRGEQELRALADSMPHLVWIADGSGRAIWLNRRWTEYTGLSDPAVVASSWRALLRSDEAEEVVRTWQRTLASSSEYEKEFHLRGADGRYRLFLARAVPVRDASGRVVQWFGTHTDLDAIEQTRAAMREESLVLETLNETGRALAAQLDLQQLVQQITDAATRLSGARSGAFFYNATDGNGDVYMLCTLSGADCDSFEKFVRSNVAPPFGPDFPREGVIRSDDVLDDPRYGRRAPLHGAPSAHRPVRSYLAVPVTLGSDEVAGGLFFGHPDPGMFSERSERFVMGIATQAAVALDNARLYEAVKRAGEERKHLLAAEREARADAERASRLKDEFLSTLSHELRTPLSAIVGWSQILQGGKADAARITQAVEVIKRNAEAQVRLIDDLLDMSRIVSGKLRLDVRPVDPVAVAESALDVITPAAAAKGIEFEKRMDPGTGPVLGDPDRLHQAVWNLLSNALKFTPPGGRVELTVTRAGSQAQIAVTDSGAGIAAEFLPHVFERFRQADSSTTRAHGGLGLGLAIVRQLVELHGGTVAASSPGPGLGSTFVVRLPLVDGRDGGSRPTGRQAEAAVSLENARVLLVEDESDTRTLLTHVLEGAGVRVVAAEDAAAALRLIEQSPPDLMLSDIGLPGTDGYALMRAVRRLPEHRGGTMPAIALTAFAQPEDRNRSALAGFQAHIPKPFDLEDLLATIGRLLGRAA